MLTRAEVFQQSDRVTDLFIPTDRTIIDRGTWAKSPNHQQIADITRSGQAGRVIIVQSNEPLL